ncbi:MAG TPA: sugar ABC transporter ATP-binding protein [Thermoleophilaceae bacterium]|nr:sugar ABC transporter ATP-binding protein [Thermoleophilaceae bacterium]
MNSAGVPVLEAVGMRKSYGGVRALRGVDLRLWRGEVHALVGENGSGKSTLLRIAAGQLTPDAGRLRLEGRELRFTDASEAITAGIATVTQETTLVPDLSVTENIFLGHRKVRAAYGIDWRATRTRAREALARLGLTSIDPAAPVRRLRPDEQQLVEIARAISIDARVLILDEPTSSLSDDEVGGLFEVVRALVRQGVAVAFVSHRIGEVFDLADRATVLRDGEVVGSDRMDRYDRRRMIQLMTGRELDELELDRGRHRARDPVLRVRGLSIRGRVHDATLEVGRGEIVGLAGLVGAGRSELLEALFGVNGQARGAVEVAGEPMRPSAPLDAMRSGLAYVPADRKNMGLVLDMSVRENVLMARTATHARVRRPRRGAEHEAVGESMDAFRIVAGSYAAPVAQLSGGNQQKVVLAKWLGTKPKVLLMDEPTRGVDVGAKAEIYRLLNRAKEEGVGVLVSSSETPELLLLCDRILVMYRGRIVAALSREEATEGLIARYAMGHN